jgi:ureidoglycolate lyase
MAVIEQGIEVRTVVAEPITREAFAPFGELLSVEGRERLPIDLYGDKVDVYRADFHSNRPMEWLLTTLRVREFEIRWLERHLELTQTFIPLGGHPFVLAVAAPGARLEHDVPALDEIRAFIVPGTVGAQIHVGTWHEPPFGLVQEQVVVYTSHADLTAGLGSNLNERKSIGQLDVDKRNIAEHAGHRVKITLP